jgi:hypothetical protein
MHKEEDIALILFLHKNKRLKHSDSVFGCEATRRQRIDVNNKHRFNYFVNSPVYLERSLGQGQ